MSHLVDNNEKLSVWKIMFMDSFDDKDRLKTALRHMLKKVVKLIYGK